MQSYRLLHFVTYWLVNTFLAATSWQELQAFNRLSVTEDVFTESLLGVLRLGGFK